jgi:hypothetical protein
MRSNSPSHQVRPDKSEQIGNFASNHGSKLSWQLALRHGPVVFLRFHCSSTYRIGLYTN